MALKMTPPAIKPVAAYKMAPPPVGTNMGGKDAPAGRPMEKMGKKDMPRLGKAC